MLTLPVWLEVLREAARLGAKVVATPAQPPVELGPTGLPAEALHALPADLAPAELARQLRPLGAEAVLSLSDPDPPRLRDARATDLLVGRPPPARGSQAAVARAMHKGATREVCAACGVRVAPGIWVARPGRLAELPAEWGDLVVVKEVDGWAGRGMALHRSRDAALRDVGQRAASVIVEQFVAGEEVSVEAVIHGETEAVLGWVLKGPTELGVHPLFRLRYVPELPLPRRLEAAALLALRALGIDQLVELEFVAADDGEWYLLEVNPRASGVTALLRAANGVGSPAVAIRLASGLGVPRAGPRRCACEFSVPPQAWPALVDLARGMDDLVHLHGTVTNAFWPRCYLAADSPERLHADVVRLASVCGTSLVAQLERRLAAAASLSGM